MFLRLFSILILCKIVLSHENDTLSQKPGDFWDESDPFAQAEGSPNLRLPSDVLPSFYRLKIKADLESSNFTGEVYITIRANKKVKEIVLHSKKLTIKSNAKLTEQIYEKVETLHMRRRRDVPDVQENNITKAENVTAIATEGSILNQSVTLPISSVETTTAVTELREATVQNDSITAVPSIQNTSVSDVDAAQSTSSSVMETTTKPAVRSDNVTVSDTHTQVTHSSVRNIKILSIAEAEGDRLILTLATALKPDVDYILEISFQGQISDSLTGFYKSTYTNANKEEKSLAVTQFEPTSARAAFPCFDEPAFKARFEISVAHRRNLTALSNMKIATKEPIADQPDWEWTHFERSVRMSTYLVAYILCDFVSLDTSYLSTDNVSKPIRIWTRPELIKKAEYAASITPKLLAYYEEVFGVPYALDKLDLIAIPDFGSGAMENWGLITFRETTLLFDPTSSVPRDKQNVAIDVAHELAHQWFGNLVTMTWWTDLWLNEGFASYIEYTGVDQVEPGWKMLEALTRDMLDLLRSDALKNTSPVSRTVVDASDIAQKFDEISYTKGATLIRMLNNTISEQLFHKGLKNYLNKWKYSNAEENDLWASMAEAVTSEPTLRGRSLVRFMNTWTRQPGYPVLTVTRDYDTGVVHFEQKLFSSSANPYKKMLEQLWEIPISYVAVDAPAPQWSIQPKLWLSERSTSATLPLNATQALYVNIGATGYYRVNYDARNWEQLSLSLHAGLVHSPVTTAQLIDDAFNLAKAGLVPYTRALTLTTCVIKGEDSRMVWDLLLNNMAFLKHNLKTTSGYVYFQDYMKILLRKQLETLNFGLQAPKDDDEAFFIENLVMWECMVESPRCLDWAKAEFHKWTSQPDPTHNPTPPHLRSLVMNTALKYGGRREFDFLWDVFSNSSDPGVKSLVITNLPSTRDPALIHLLLERSMSEVPKQYAVAAWGVDSPAGARVAQRFLAEHFQRVLRVFTDLDAFMFPAVLNGAFGSITTEDELDKLKSFALEHKAQLAPMSQTLQKLVDISHLRIAWVQQHAPEIVRWLKEYVTGTSNSSATNKTTTQPPAPRDRPPSDNNDSNYNNDKHDALPPAPSSTPAGSTPPPAGDVTTPTVPTSSNTTAASL